MAAAQFSFVGVESEESLAGLRDAAATSHTGILLLFTAGWCGSCRVVKPVVARCMEAAWSTGARVPAAVVDVDALPDVASAEKIQELPTIVCFDASGTRTAYTGSKADKVWGAVRAPSYWRGCTC